MSKKIKLKEKLLTSSGSIHHEEELDEFLNKTNGIVAYTTLTSNGNITFSNLNMGNGVYDIYFDACSAGTETVCYMRLNGKNSISQEVFETNGSTYLASKDGGVNRIGTVHKQSSFIHICLFVHGGYSRIISTGGRLNKINVCIFETQANIPITTVEFYAENGIFTANSTAMIIKRFGF